MKLTPGSSTPRGSDLRGSDSIIIAIKLVGKPLNATGNLTYPGLEFSSEDDDMPLFHESLRRIGKKKSLKNKDGGQGYNSVVELN